jgi:hypothetical protein
MNNSQKLFLQLPEYLLILAIIFYWVSAAIILNPIAIGLIALLIIQIATKNKTLGLIIPGILIFSSLFLLMALWSELNELPTFNNDAKILLIVGLTFFLSTIVISTVMIYKYAIINSKKGS